jgi:hypothetical protein
MSGQQALTSLERKQLCPLTEDNPNLKYKDLIEEAFFQSTGGGSSSRARKMSGEASDMDE